MTIRKFLQKTFCSFFFLLFRLTVIAFSGGQSTTVDWALLKPTGDLSLYQMHVLVPLCSRLHICPKRTLEFCICGKICRAKEREKIENIFSCLGIFSREKIHI